MGRGSGSHVAIFGRLQQSSLLNSYECDTNKIPNPHLAIIIIVVQLYKNFEFLGAPLAQGHDHFSSGCDFMMSLGKPKLCTTFEIASFNRCRNNKGEAPNFGELPYCLLYTSDAADE